MAEEEVEELNSGNDSQTMPRPEYKRRLLYLLGSFLTLGIISLVPTPMDPLAQRALGVLGFVAFLWVTEAFPLGMSALFGIILLPVLDVLPLPETFFGFKNTALFFLLGALSFGIAMQKTNLHKRVALQLLKRIGKSPSTIIFSICLLGCYMSMTMPCHAVAALLLPVLVGIIDAGDINPGQNFGIALFLALTFGTSVGSIGTLLGGARNVLAIGILESVTEPSLSISFLDWAIAGIPIASVLMVLTYFTLKQVYPWGEIDTKKIRSGIREEVKEMGDLSSGEKKAALIFVITIALWIFIGKEIGLSVVAIGGFFALVASRTITWQDVKQNMPWDLIFLYGGALTLSHALTQKGTVVFISENLIGFVGNNPWIIMVTFLILVIVISNLMSNSAATAVVLPVAISAILRPEIGAGYSGELVTYIIAMGSAMVFLLPIGTPSAAIVYSSGYVEVKDLLKAGSVLTIVCIVAFITLGMGWWKFLGLW